MSTQPEALRLADAICDYSRLGFETEEAAKKRHNKDRRDAAAELRRLHAVNEELLEALKAIRDDEGTRLDWRIYDKARAAIAKAGGEA